MDLKIFKQITVRNVVFAILFSLMTSLALIISPKPSFACCWPSCPNCGCVSVAHSIMRRHFTQEHEMTKSHVEEQFNEHRSAFLYGYFFQEHIEPAMMAMTEQLTVNAMQHALIIGTFFDAENQLETQRLHQELQARAHKDYHPSIGVCEFGTLTRNLTASEMKGGLTKRALSSQSIDRQLLQDASVATAGTGFEPLARMAQYKERYCSTEEFGKQTDALCGTSADSLSIFKDIDYARVVGRTNTLNLDFSNNITTGPFDSDEVDVIALSRNLYGYRLMPIIENVNFRRNSGNIATLLDYRSIVAKRGVAENSFYNLLALKTPGTEGAEENRIYLKNIAAQLGLSNTDELDFIIGTRPSYDAQMDFLTKKLYQRPEFYTELYDKPANIDRKAAALKSVKLMQDMDKFDSQLRQEMMLSVLLETYIATQQAGLQERLDGLE